MKKILVVLAVLVVAGYFYFKPKRYEYRGLKFVEYHNGTTCSYMQFDIWEQLPLICGATSKILEVDKYR